MEDGATPEPETPETPPVETRPASPPQPAVHLSRGRASLYMFTSVLMFLTQGLGMNLLNANLYQLQGAFSATVNELAWLSAAYMAPYASLSVALFKIRTQYGLRRFAELGILCFVFAAFANLFVSDLHSALIIRFVNGIAAAPLSTIGILYMLEAFPPEKKLSMGLSLAVTNTLLSAPLARILSPALMEYGGWRALYTFEVALALIALPFIYLLPVTAPPRAKVIQTLDIFSYLILAGGFGCLAIILSLGRFYWWFEAPWLGVLLACAVGLLSVFVAIEINRSQPMLDLRWIFSWPNIHMAGVLILFRTVSSEQTATVSGFYQQIGLQNDQTMTLYAIVLAASVAGGLFCTFLMVKKQLDLAHVIALVLIGAGAWLDSQSTNLTRPEQMFLSQALVGAGAAMFLPPVMTTGFGAALAKGPIYVVNFIVIFLFTQSLGSLMASAALGSFVTIREKFHSNLLAEQIMLSDPLVANRVAQLAGSYGKVIIDKTLLNTEGLQLLTQQVSREAYVLAYNDAFFVIFIGCAISLAILVGHLIWRRLVAPPDAAVAPA
ncbi:MFS transporter [Rhizobium sp. Leaf384]|nr:MFS transporter [Rhizobium sp. Leaf341]KQS81500.1 MFS transporter [Rhizobium sp. Leaf384]KQS86624.1 MFS transporter [Rhizobium sp. Leaf383]